MDQLLAVKKKLLKSIGKHEKVKEVSKVSVLIRMSESPLLLKFHNGLNTVTHLKAAVLIKQFVPIETRAHLEGHMVLCFFGC